VNLKAKLVSLLAVLAFFVLPVGGFLWQSADAASGDLSVLVRGTQGGSRKDLLRFSSSYALLPGVTSITNLGSSSLIYKGMYGTDAYVTSINAQSPVTVTTHTTLTAASGSFVLLNAGGATNVTLPAASSVPNRTIRFQDKSGGTNAVTFYATSGNVNGGTNSTAFSTAYGGRDAYSDGTNWFLR